MTPHTQFMIADAVSMVATSPFLVLARLRRLPHRGLMTWLYVAGYGLIALTFIVDSVFNPPLYFQGFTPGIGIGLLLAYVGRYVLDALEMRSNRLKPERAV